MVFLAPMGAHNAIAIEAWQVVAQWDVETVDGTTNIIRHGTYAGDPEHTQTLANLRTRITTAATSDAFANNRIANVSGLQAYYTTIGAYEDITPDDGQTTTFTPAQPLPMRPCANGTAVPNPRDNRMLVQDCEVLLDLERHAGRHGHTKLEHEYRHFQLGRRDDWWHPQPRDTIGAHE